MLMLLMAVFDRSRFVHCFFSCASVCQMYLLDCLCVALYRAAKYYNNKLDNCIFLNFVEVNWK